MDYNFLFAQECRYTTIHSQGIPVLSLNIEPKDRTPGLLMHPRTPTMLFMYPHYRINHKPSVYITSNHGK